jgi:hypothetical protein
MIDPTHGPIEQEQRAMMNDLAQALDKFFNGNKKHKNVAFILLTAKFGDIEDGRVNYISNGERADMISMLKEFLARAEGRVVADTPKTKQ